MKNNVLRMFHLISIADSFADGQLQLDVGLLQLVSLSLDSDRGFPVVAGLFLKVRSKQRLHQSRLSEAGLADA